MSIARMSETGTPLLAGYGISRRFGQFHALRNATFAVPRGGIVGLIGPNGAGKTTLFECVAGLSPLSAGRVELNGHAANTEERKKALFYLPDGVRPFAEQRVHWVMDFARAVFGNGAPADSAITDTLGIARLANSRLGSLSKGEHKRVMLAIALASAPPLLLLDEPFDGLDLRQTRETMSLLRTQLTCGRTLFLSIHQLTDAEQVCDRFVLLSSGATVGEGTLSDLRTQAGAGHERSSLSEVFLALT